MGKSKEHYAEMTLAEILEQDYGLVDFYFMKKIAEDAQWEEQEELINN